LFVYSISRTYLEGGQKMVAGSCADGVDPKDRRNREGEVSPEPSQTETNRGDKLDIVWLGSGDNSLGMIRDTGGEMEDYADAGDPGSDE